MTIRIKLLHSAHVVFSRVADSKASRYLLNLKQTTNCCRSVGTCFSPNGEQAGFGARRPWIQLSMRRGADMKTTCRSAIMVMLTVCGVAATPRIAQALDAPHNTNDQQWSITCSACHYAPSSLPTWATLPTTTDCTTKNNLCMSCHSATGMPSADPRYTDIRTHSATVTGSDYWEGDWSVECVVCHSCVTHVSGG